MQKVLGQAVQFQLTFIKSRSINICLGSSIRELFLYYTYWNICCLSKRTIRGRDIRWLTVRYMEEISDQAISTWLMTLCDYLVFIFLNLRIKFPAYGLKATVIFVI